MYPGEYSTVDQFAANKIAVFPYAGSGITSGAIQAGTDGGDVSGALLAIRAAISQTLPSTQVNLFSFSGGAQTINLALGKLSSDERSRIGNITYMMPGSNPFGGSLATGNGTTTYIKGTGVDGILPVPSARPPQGTYDFIQSGCEHSAVCAIKTYGQLLNNLSGFPCTTHGVITPTGIKVGKGTATTYGGGASSGVDGGIFFWPTYGPEGDLTRGYFAPFFSPSPSRLELKVK
jgi:hypothetical protein